MNKLIYISNVIIKRIKINFLIKFIPLFFFLISHKNQWLHKDYAMYNEILFLGNLIYIHNFIHLTSIISMQYFSLFIDLKYRTLYRNTNKSRICFIYKH